MKFTGWSDGSYSMNNGESYIAYVIADCSGNVLVEYKAKILQADSVISTEFAALMALFNKIDELGIKNINIYSDSQSMVESIKQQKTNNLYKTYDQILNSHFGEVKRDYLVDSLQWRSRDHNLADHLFRGNMPYETIKHFFVPINIVGRRKRIELDEMLYDALYKDRRFKWA